MLSHATPLLIELRKHAHTGGDVVEEGREALKMVRTLLANVNSTNVHQWSTMRPEEVQRMWNDAVKAVVELSSTIEHLLHARISLTA